MTKVNMHSGALRLSLSCGRILAVFLLSLASATAQAFIDPPYITPANPMAGTSLTLNVHAGECDFLRDETTISRTGNIVHVDVFTNHQTDPLLCNADPVTRQYALGAFAPGTYTFSISRSYVDNSGVVFEPLADIFLTVAPSTIVPAATPALSALGGVLLVLLLVVGARSGHGLLS
jgi:hypothetical protein